MPTRERHTLRDEGAPHDEKGDRVKIGRAPYGVGGEGRAKCSCGWLSEVLTSSRQRRGAHATHRAEALGR